MTRPRSLSPKSVLAAIIGLSALPDRHLETISGRIRFLGASLWTSPQSSCVTSYSSAATSDLTTTHSGHRWSPSLSASERLFLPPWASPNDRRERSSRQLDRVSSPSEGRPNPDFDADGFEALGPGFDGDSRVVFYATTPGAFVDMAADFGYALDTPTITPDDPARSADSSDRDVWHGLDRCDEHRPIVLDADLPPPTTTSGLVGLDELSTVERSVGIMIDHGHHPDHAHATLRCEAAAAGVELHIYAARLLRR